MKKCLLLVSFCFLFVSFAEAQTAYVYKVITSIESIVPGGLGRSRIIDNKTDVNYNDFTTARTNGKKSDQGKVRRKDIRVDQFEETKLLNYYSLTGINFQNVASNDAVISDKINELSIDGWELAFVTSGVEADSGETDGHGIFVTRYIFKKKIDLE